MGVMGVLSRRKKLKKIWQLRPVVDLQSSVCSPRRVCMALVVYAGIRGKKIKIYLVRPRVGQATSKWHI